ncbi:MAG: aminodeoxychorismate/anthranilate synthase component II [Vicinamibacterales bacterium]
MVFVLDNYDSFTYNLVQYLGELGADVVVKRNDEVTVDEIKALAPERIVLSPGPGRPEDAGVMMDVIKQLGPTTPIFGVCLGHQAIGAVFGGSVVRASAPMHGKTSTIEHNSRGLFTGLNGPIEASRATTRSSSPTKGFRRRSNVTARTQGDGVIMGLRHRTLPMHGVQFHPESILTSEGPAILPATSSAGTRWTDVPAHSSRS